MKTATDEIIRPLSEKEKQHLAKCETEIASGLAVFNVVGNALLDIRDAKLYRESHKTFKEYCDDKWDMSSSRAYQLCDAAAVMENFKSQRIVDKPKNEMQPPLGPEMRMRNEAAVAEPPPTKGVMISPLKIMDGPGKMPSEAMRKLFEMSVVSTAKMKKHFPLEPQTEGGEFSGYGDPKTDLLWVGFAIGLRCAERYRNAGHDMFDAATFERIEKGLKR